MNPCPLSFECPTLSCPHCWPQDRNKAGDDGSVLGVLETYCSKLLAHDENELAVIHPPRLALEHQGRFLW